ncbi:N-acetylmuramoyl-L-alanine amidase [Paenibacillus sp. cl141a]|uniref:N-acetylmuramoyl-L-alanine amidase family protein n=1 Tax=Paenibacillus sp. cl141a TaxID=1761877 RepID=UPI0008C0D59B|nr:N-acetylmuramoyl-L-alanine amidase family protein [Paenibacillus sp. cl141a]SEK37617.1 N-acetylmuramoyl-L-alanine amidase [Paenibacillus sp. cl141a]
MKKSMMMLLFTALLLFLIPMHTQAAAKQTKIFLDGQELVLPHSVEVVNIRNNIMIPIRVVAENLKFNVNWDKKTQNVHIQQGSKAISLTVGKNEALVENDTVTLNVAPQMIKNTVVVPMRFVSEEMGLSVGWNNKDKLVTLSSNTSLPSEPSNESGIEAATNQIHEINYASNQLVVSLDQEITPVITTLQNPERIVVDFPSTNLGDMGQALSGGAMGRLDTSESPNITDIRYSLFKNDPAQVRIVIELNNVRSVNYEQQTIAGKFILDLSMVNEPVPITPVSSGKKIVVIDPGHGGSDPGTTSFSKKPEKIFALALGLKVQALLQQESGIEVIMTRETDIYPTRSERVKLANDLKADVFVSIHGNSVKAAPQVSGTETYYYQRESSKELANLIHHNLIKALGFKDRSVRNGNYQVIRETTMSAVLLEIGFLSNKSEEEAMMSETNQNKAAQAIVDGIKEYLTL